jgi:hypothetical protein
LVKIIIVQQADLSIGLGQQLLSRACLLRVDIITLDISRPSKCKFGISSETSWRLHRGSNWRYATLHIQPGLI